MNTIMFDKLQGNFLIRVVRCRVGHYADAQGEITTDPWKSAMLLPSGGHKGFALGMMVEVLCSTLSGMAFGPHTVPMYGPNSDPGTANI